MEQSREEKTQEAEQVLTDEVKISPSRNDDAKKKRVRIKTKNKQVECKVCFRNMRSDHLTRHMRTHEILFTGGEDEMREEIRRIKQVRDERENQERAIQKMAEEEGISLENCGINVPNTLPQGEISEKEEKEGMCKDHHQHQRLIERGKRITNIMIIENISEGSLTRERKHALDLYRKERSLQDL